MIDAVLQSALVKEGSWPPKRRVEATEVEYASFRNRSAQDRLLFEIVDWLMQWRRDRGLPNTEPRQDQYRIIAEYFNSRIDCAKSAPVASLEKVFDKFSFDQYVGQRLGVTGAEEELPSYKALLDSPSITASTLPLRQKFDPRSVEDGYGVGKEEVGESTLGSKKPHVVESKSSKSDGLGSSVRRAGRKKGSNESSNSGIGLGPDNAGGTEREWDDGAPPRPVYRLSQAPSSSTRPFLTKEPEEMSVGPPVENAPSTPNSRNLTHRSLFAKAASWPPPALKPAKVVGCSAPSTPRGRYTGERLIQSRVLTTPNQRSWANQSHGDRIQLDLSLEEYYELLANARWREGFEMGTRMHDFYAERELNRFAMEG